MNSRLEMFLIPEQEPLLMNLLLDNEHSGQITTLEPLSMKDIMVRKTEM